MVCLGLRMLNPKGPKDPRIRVPLEGSIRGEYENLMSMRRCRSQKDIEALTNYINRGL